MCPDRNCLASQSSFELDIGGWLPDVWMGTGGPAAFWGDLSTATRKSKPDDGALVESQSSDILVGIDAPYNEAIMYGIAFSRSSDKSDFSDSSASGASGVAETRFTTYAPYVQWTAEAGYSVWGSFFGKGSGTLKMTSGSSTVETDVDLSMRALGLKSASSPVGEMHVALRGTGSSRR